ncbi:pilus assembly protein PilP [Variovorax sp. PCZ-1]|uniref:pilus assembly protein PilP n=1 Tax=Variovorax sp. PCZ-1 TaxID=2835533 RepID=UPI001BCC0A1C|nr:pilus assembly protein PilP [Variovorax sp. PCZ-1]MBS7808417.1 pilus assembly protein PilP [Variovorax sp. PCZ-1]
MNTITPIFFRALLCFSFLPFLTACFGDDQQDIKQWMQEQRNATKPNVPPIPEPKKFTPESYKNDLSIEPFSNQKLTQALKRESSQATANAALVAPELNRRKEVLEGFPLDAISMVGTMLPKGVPVALVKVDKLLYQVRLGSYLGQNYGKVVKLSETELVLREIVQDAAGEWIERQASLQLQEGSK